jgi:hypothetical protein
MSGPFCYGRLYGRRQICNEKIQRIREMLAKGHTQRATAKIVGVSRVTVHRVVKGKILEVTGSRAGEKDGLDFGEISIQPPDTSRAPSRCGCCGALVHLPCLACQIRQLSAKSFLRPLAGP